MPTYLWNSSLQNHSIADPIESEPGMVCLFPTKWYVVNAKPVSRKPCNPIVVFDWFDELSHYHKGNDADLLLRVYKSCGSIVHNRRIRDGNKTLEFRAKIKTIADLSGVNPTSVSNALDRLVEIGALRQEGERMRLYSLRKDTKPREKEKFAMDIKDLDRYLKSEKMQSRRCVIKVYKALWKTGSMRNSPGMTVIAENIKVSDIAKKAKITEMTASKSLKQLIALGLVRVLRGERNRDFEIYGLGEWLSTRMTTKEPPENGNTKLYFSNEVNPLVNQWVSGKEGVENGQEGLITSYIRKGIKLNEEDIDNTSKNNLSISHSKNPYQAETKQPNPGFPAEVEKRQDASVFPADSPVLKVQTNQAVDDRIASARNLTREAVIRKAERSKQLYGMITVEAFEMDWKSLLDFCFRLKDAPSFTPKERGMARTFLRQDRDRKPEKMRVDFFLEVAAGWSEFRSWVKRVMGFIVPEFPTWEIAFVHKYWFFARLLKRKHYNQVAEDFYELPPGTTPEDFGTDYYFSYVRYRDEVHRRESKYLDRQRRFEEQNRKRKMESGAGSIDRMMRSMDQAERERKFIRDYGKGKL